MGHLARECSGPYNKCGRVVKFEVLFSPDDTWPCWSQWCQNNQFELAAHCWSRIATVTLNPPQLRADVSRYAVFFLPQSRLQIWPTSLVNTQQLSKQRQRWQSTPRLHVSITFLACLPLRCCTKTFLPAKKLQFLQCLGF